MRSQTGDQAARTAAGNRRRDFFCVDSKASRCFSLRFADSGRRTPPNAPRFAEPQERRRAGPRRIPEEQSHGRHHRRPSHRRWYPLKIVYPSDQSAPSLRELIEGAEAGPLFIGDPRVEVRPGARMFERMSQVLRDTGAGMVYSDAVGHPRIDYQPGSIRDNFDFGPVIAVSVEAAREAGCDTELKWGALYDLRLRLSEKLPVLRIPEPLYSASVADARPSGQKQFDYVDPRNRDYQVEMERIATEYLKRTGAYLEPRFRPVSATEENYPVKASVVIPVRNREKTILDAVRSVLDQQADFRFNVIVVGNHSTDRTTEILRGMADSRLVHIIPDRRDMGIGGCWNEAIYSAQCGRYTIQLDSDDLYVNDSVLHRIYDELERGPYAMVIGSYSMVDFSLREIPPVLIA